MKTKETKIKERVKKMEDRYLIKEITKRTDCLIRNGKVYYV